ncbi:Kazrin [Pteropus alecto]|uniref:Kazrin n=1 Tax=Pteropus alecto TaxID=9402 RepID=L5KIB3_PTEAL|nr:Kazrin [Pteropus alecto]
MKEMLTKDLEESQGGKSSEVLSATELRVQLVQKEQELARAKEALQGVAQILELLSPSKLKVAVFLKSRKVGTFSHREYCLASCKVINQMIPPLP